MGIHNSTSEIAAKMTGLHLYHAGLSNCAARVRIVLYEKGLDWTSHELDLRAGENVSEWYFEIHPHGVVPALVHDGAVVIESIDIVRYLDERYPEPPLSPREPVLHTEMDKWLQSAADLHIKGVKTFFSIICDFLPFGPLAFKYATSLRERISFFSGALGLSGLASSMPPGR